MHFRNQRSRYLIDFIQYDCRVKTFPLLAISEYARERLEGRLGLPQKAQCPPRSNLHGPRFIF